MDLLDGAVQRYAWGATDVIADLQGRVADGGPEAELWFGAHPVAPSRLATGGRSLDEVVAQDPAAVLGPAVAERFGRFPYLLKVLAAAEPLSIQAHPSRDQARAGFAREERDGPVRDDPRRTYRDDNHKPELIVALTPFEAKCGFRAPEATATVVRSLTPDSGPGRADLDHWVDLLTDPAIADEAIRLRRTLAWLLGLDPDRARQLVATLVPAARSTPAVGGGEVAWLADLDHFHPGDIGVAVSLLLNHVSLAPGQAMFLPAGNLHAYLRGAGVELMANSDNVIRGGLTVKHIDVDELLTVVDTAPGPPPIETAGPGVHRFSAPVPEFALHRHQARVEAQETVVEPEGPEIVLVTEGRAVMEAIDGSKRLEVAQGRAGLASAADGAYRLTVEAGATAWRAGVGPRPPSTGG